jgi:hypothetical protein
MLVFYETWRVHVDIEMYVLNFCSEFFDVLKKFFPAVGAYAPMPRIEFLLYIQQLFWIGMELF